MLQLIEPTETDTILKFTRQDLLKTICQSPFIANIELAELFYKQYEVTYNTKMIKVTYPSPANESFTFIFRPNTKPTFENELVSLINKFSKETESDTPDFILSNHIMMCLDAFKITVKARDKWYAIYPWNKKNKDLET